MGGALPPPWYNGRGNIALHYSTFPDIESLALWSLSHYVSWCTIKYIKGISTLIVIHFHLVKNACGGGSGVLNVRWLFGSEAYQSGYDSLYGFWGTATEEWRGEKHTGTDVYYTPLQTKLQTQY